MLNQVTICGRLGRDPEVRKAGNQSVSTFSLALSEKWKDKDGEQKEKTSWVRVEAWGVTGQIAAEASKGDELVVTGSLETQKWEDKDGNKRETTFVRARTVHHVTNKSEKSQKTKTKSEGSGRSDPLFDDDIPF